MSVRSLRMILTASLCLPALLLAPPASRGTVARAGAAVCSDAAYNVRCADMTDAADAEAYQRAIESQDRLLRPSLSGDAPDRTLSVRWATTATVTVLVATLSEAPATVVGPLERAENACNGHATLR